MGILAIGLSILLATYGAWFRDTSSSFSFVWGQEVAGGAEPRCTIDYEPDLCFKVFISHYVIMGGG